MVIATLTEDTEFFDFPPHPTETAVGADCFGAECGQLNVTNRPNLSPRVTTVPGVQFNNLELREAQLSSRRRQRSRVRAASDSEGSNTSIELDSTLGASTKPTGRHWPVLSVLVSQLTYYSRH